MKIVWDGFCGGQRVRTEKEKGTTREGYDTYWYVRKGALGSESVSVADFALHGRFVSHALNCVHPRFLDANYLEFVCGNACCVFLKGS